MTELTTSVHRSISEVKRGEWNAVVAQQSRTGSVFERYEWAAGDWERRFRPVLGERTHTRSRPCGEDDGLHG